MSKGHGENEVICMDYEHENQFGQESDRGQREHSVRQSRRYNEGASTQRRPSYQEGQMPGAGTRREIPGPGRQAQGGRTGSGRPVPGGRPGAEMPSPGRQAAEAKRMQGRMDAGETGTIRRPTAGREDTRSMASFGTRAGGMRAGAANGAAQAMRETAASGSTGEARGAEQRAADGRTQKKEEDSKKAIALRRTAASSGGGSRAAAQAKYERARLKKKRRRIIAMIVAECFTLMFIFGYAYLARRFNMIQRADFDPKEVENKEISLDTTQKMKGYRMIAIFGVDSRDSNVGAGCQSDVNMICCINEDTGEIKLVSVYRDTYLNINDQGSYRKFNAAYTNGGPEQALRALNKNLDLNITQYVTFSWKSVADGINILGGVDLDITKSEFRFINGFITETVEATGVASRHLTSAGPQHLDGVQAVAYGRLRLMDTDYARTERQRKIIELAFAKAKQADYSVLNNILVVILPSISTNISFADMTTMALGINKYYIGETAGFPFAKANANMPGKGDCVIPQTLVSNVSQLHTFLFGDEEYEPTEQVKTISSKVSSDSGMYKEGKVSTGSALSTDSYVPKETTRAAETTARERETTESGELEPVETDRDGNLIEEFPGMTDENGELIDGPVEDWPEEADPLSPGVQQGNLGTISPGQQGNTHIIGRPGDESSESSGSQGPGESTGPGGGRTEPGDSQQVGGSAAGIGGPGESTSNITGPGENAANGPGDTTPGESTTGPGDTTPAGSTTGPGGTTPGGNTISSGDTTPGGNGASNAGDSLPGGNSPMNPGGTSAEEQGPGVVSQPGNDNYGPGVMAGDNGESPQGPGL